MSDGDSGFNEFTSGFDPGFGAAPEAAAPLLSSEDILKQGREIAGEGVPLQLTGLLEALTQLRAKSTGSTASLFPAIQGQLGSLRAQYAKASQALARKLGPAGGGYVKQGQGALLNQSAQQYMGLLGQGQQQGFAGLLNVLGNIQPLLSGTARAPNVGIKESPFDFAPAGAGLAGQAKIIGDLLRSSGTANTTSINRTPFVAGSQSFGAAQEDVFR